MSIKTKEERENTKVAIRKRRIRELNRLSLWTERVDWKRISCGEGGKLFWLRREGVGGESVSLSPPPLL